ncbi:glycosyltransferase [Shewanella vesiculosa]|uniref:Glycosyltransferase n=1 Tax=Shewanella vesiculosa TaxID=518738 RepID=A0ABV0FLB1_9GAMM
MIFLTVGTQLPFDRLVKSVDNYCDTKELHVIAQIGSAIYRPINLEYKDFYQPDEVDSYFDAASVIISHAGMGTIISCIKKSKPLILFPRLSIKGEHRNDHQMDTIKSFLNFTGIYIAYNEVDLFNFLDRVELLEAPKNNLDTQCKELLSFINSFYF